MAGDPPNHQDPRRRPRRPRWSDNTRFTQGAGDPPPAWDPEETRVMPAGEEPAPGAGPSSAAEARPGRPLDAPAPAGPPAPDGNARRLGEDDLPPPPRWALPPQAQSPAAPPGGPPARPRVARPESGSPVPSARPVAAPAARPAAVPPSRPVAAAGAVPRRARPPVQAATLRRRRLLAAGILAALLLLTCAWIVPLLFKSQALISDVFVAPPPRPAGVSAFPDWSKQDRVNILLLGLDTRVPGDARSDTLILVSVDPAHKTAAMLSIPRDLWVPIPGFGENRINAAYQFGETNHTPGGGPGLAMQTVEQNFGVPVHYYAQVEFAGFQRIVDALGGVTVDVPQPLIDNEYPADYGSAYQRVYIPAGLQHMDGHTALQYVRSRHSDSDLGRNGRQQAVLLALREEGLQFSVLTKLDQILTNLKGALRTDLSFTEVGSLARLAQSIPRAQVSQLAIGADMTTPGDVDGAQVLLPRWDVIRPAVQRLVGAPDLATEGAVVAVQNGTDTAGLALQTAEKLRGAGFNVPANLVGNPPDGGGGHYPQSYILDYTGGQKPLSLTRLLALLKLDRSRVRPGAADTRPPGADLLVMIGDDHP